MGIFSFIKESGEKIFGAGKAQESQPSTTTKRGSENNEAHKSEEAKANDRASRRLRETLTDLKLKAEKLDIQIEGDTAIVTGKPIDQATKEKIILVVGNSEGIAKVDDRLTLEKEKEEREAKFHTVEQGETLSKISKDHYGNANKYNLIFEANKPMLKDPDKIYPGQVLRIPSEEK